jgi:hypothetical protein
MVAMVVTANFLVNIVAHQVNDAVKALESS